MTEYKGEHYTIYNADCTSLMNDMDAGSVDLVVTDPHTSSKGLQEEVI